MKSTEWILLIVLVQSFHPTLSLLSYDEIPETECVRRTMKFNTSVKAFALAAFGLQQCACRSFCPNLIELVEFYIYDPCVFHLVAPVCLLYYYD